MKCRYKSRVILGVRVLEFTAFWTYGLGFGAYGFSLRAPYNYQHLFIDGLFQRTLVFETSTFSGSLHG